MTASETKTVKLKELTVNFPRISVVSAGRNRNGGSAKFSCEWDDSAAATLGLKEPEDGDEILKIDSLRATRVYVRQSLDEIQMKRRIAEIEQQLPPMRIDNVRLSRRKAESGKYESLINFTLHFHTCPDALEQLEFFMTCTKKQPSLQVMYLPKVKQPEQIASKEMQTK